MKRKPSKKHDDVTLDAEEKALLKSYERGEWKRSKRAKKDIELAEQAAENYLRKDARINIRISSSDLRRIKQKAAYEGLPYQSLIASILHKYASGHLEDQNF